MSDFEGNVHQWGDERDREDAGPQTIVEPCNYCGHSRYAHEHTCNLCECIQFEEGAELEEVEKR